MGGWRRLDRMISRGVVVLLVAVGLASLSNSYAPGVVFILSLLGAMALVPRLNPLMFWPVGLMTTVVIVYVGYLVGWFRGSVGVSADRAEETLGVAIVVFGALAFLRAQRLSLSLRKGWTPKIIESMFVLVAPLILLFVGTRRLDSESLALFSGYMSGGDHGLHNEIIHDLLAWSSTPSSENPFTLYTYPRGLHYLIANLVSVGSVSSTQGTLVQEYLTGAWFEYVQLAAFVQLCTVIFVRWSREHRTARALFVAPLLLVFASMDHFVPHLFWSGFMTSTAMTWALLLPIALWVGHRSAAVDVPSMRDWIVVWVLLLVFSWIVYQPYVMPIFAAGVIVAVTRIDGTWVSGRARAVQDRIQVSPWSVSLAVSGLVAVSPYFLLGADSPAITSLFLDGSTWRPALATVVAWTVVALGLCTLMRDGDVQIPDLPSILIAALVGFTLSMSGIVFFAGDDGLFDLPYYIQKMFWILLYVSIPVALGAGVSLLFRQSFFTDHRVRAGRLTAAWLVVAMVPMVQGRTPSAAVTHFSVDWFARGVFAVPPVDTETSGAFSMRDKLGSHMANLALRSASTNVLPPDVAISGNPYLACISLVDANVARVYTTPNGRAELVESGCDPAWSYVEDRAVIGPQEIEYFGVRSGVEEKFSEGSLGFRLLLRGFLPPERWGVWAGGYRSALGFDYEETLRNGSVRLVLRSQPDDETMRTVRIGINGREAASATLSLSSWSTIEVPLPDGPPGTPISLTISCDRTTEEVLADDPVDGPTPCAGLVSLKVSGE